MSENVDPFNRETWPAAEQDTTATLIQEQAAIEHARFQAALLLAFIEVLMQGAQYELSTFRLTREEALTLAGQVWRAP